MKESASDLLIGAHTSAAGGAHNALLEGQSIGATTIQLFTSNQRQWKSKELSKEEIDLWKKTLKETGLKKIMSHDSYLINLGAPDEENLIKSREAFAAEAKRCVQLDITFLNFHPGASLKGDPQECLDKIIESILLVKPIVEKGNVRLLLEATAGQGSSIGARFEELAYIINGVHNHVPIGVCIDTCHIFAAGYDIRTDAAWEATLDQFDKVVGLKHLHAFHVNDSMKELGTRVDRHAPLGEGKIGMESFKFLMKNPTTRSIPKYLETPGGPELWEKEIRMLREFA
jgi:deoxyribonuclease-4